MLKLNIKCTKFEINYSTCTVRNTERTCNSSEMFMKNERQGETQFTTKIDSFLSFIPPWMLIYFFCRFFLISPCVWPNSGLWFSRKGNAKKGSIGVDNYRSTSFCVIHTPWWAIVLNHHLNLVSLAHTLVWMTYVDGTHHNKNYDILLHISPQNSKITQITQIDNVKSKKNFNL
jgi:hypothetical protein